MKKTIAIILALVSVFSLFTGCGGSSDEIVLPKQKVAETYENRVAAILETAWAYRYKVNNIQYCNQALCVTGRAAGCRTATDMHNTPEMAGPQRTTHMTCSCYTFHCLYHAFDFRATDHWWVGIRQFIEDEDLQQYIVWQYFKEGNEKAPEDAMEEFMDILQPGDMIYYYRDVGNCHATIWLGDYDGDGDQDMINVGGTYYNAEAKEDIRENPGAVWINSERWDYGSAEEFFLTPSAYDYFPKLSDVTVYRFADEKFAKNFQITERAKTRILYPGLEIYHEADGGIYGSVAQGEELTYTVRIKNNSEQDHKGILVQMPVPQNAEVVKVDGENAANKVVKWTVDIPAGETTEHTYTVKATGSVGDVITTGTGYVHAIPLLSLNTAIVSSKPEAEIVKSALEIAKGKDGEEFLAAYLDAMGMANAIPELGDIQRGLFDRKNLGDYKTYWPKDPAEIAEEYAVIAKMQIPDYFGGQSVGTSEDSLRVKELRNQDLQAGDILIWKTENLSDVQVAVHNGEALVWARNGGLLPMEQWRLDEFIMHNFFIALRPTQAI